MNKENFINDIIKKLNDIILLHTKIKKLDKSLSKLYPISIVKNNIFYVFDVNEKNQNYVFKLKHFNPNIHIPEGILAAFPLDFYYMKASAVVSEDALNNIEGHVFIFHEFVHCYQYENYEKNIRLNLVIEKQAKEENNIMWELNHPFPYKDKFFIARVLELSVGYKKQETEKILEFYESMKDHLNTFDYEYMIWQEWKEGYARYIENKIRNTLYLELNTQVLKEPFNRVSFYELGSKHIELLINTNYKLNENLGDLYNTMYDYI